MYNQFISIEIEKYLNNHGSISNSIKDLWNNSINEHFKSIKGENKIFKLDKDKDTDYRNLDLVTSILNSDRNQLEAIGVPKGVSITRDMISSAVYSPLTGKTSITFNQNAVKKNGVF